MICMNLDLKHPATPSEHPVNERSKNQEVGDSNDQSAGFLLNPGLKVSMGFLQLCEACNGCYHPGTSKPLFLLEPNPHPCRAYDCSRLPGADGEGPWGIIYEYMLVY